MVLFRKLLGRKLVKVDHFSRKLVSCLESLTVKDDLGNQSIIRDHHCYWSEERLQVIWELCSSSVTWIHSDEHTETQVEWHHLSIKFEFWKFGFDCSLNCKHLLGYHREHLNIDSIELIETSPASSLSES